MIHPIAQERLAIRAPFRVLAALVWLFALVAFLGIGYLSLQQGRALPAKDALMLPGMLWLFRLVFHAAFFGRVPEDANWPFASFQVGSGYLLCVLILQSWN